MREIRIRLEVRYAVLDNAGGRCSPCLGNRRDKDAAIESAMGLSGRFRPVVSMVKAADPRNRKNLTGCVRTRLYWPATGRLLAQ